MGVEDIASKVGDKAKDVAGKAADGIKDKISDINDDPVGYLQKKGKDAAVDAAGSTEAGQKVKETVQDAKKVVKGVEAGARAVETVGADLEADLELIQLALDKEFWKRMFMRALKATIASITGLCSCLLAPIILSIFTVYLIISVIVGGWGASCPKHDVPTDVMQRFITYYQAFTEGATEDLRATIAGAPINKTTPEILAAVDYKETTLSDQIPVCHNLKTDTPAGCEYIVCDLTGCHRELDQACHFQCNLAAIKCRAGKIRTIMQEANDNKMSPKDIDTMRNIAYLGNFQKYDKGSTLAADYEPYTDKYIMEGYDDDVARFMKSLNQPNIALSWWNGLKSIFGITLSNIGDFFNGLFGRDIDVGAATFFRLTRPELIPERPGTPGWGTSNPLTGHLQAFVTYMQSLGTFPGLENFKFYEYQPGKLPDGCNVFSSPAGGTPAPAPGGGGSSPTPGVTPPATAWHMPSGVLNTIKSYKPIYEAAGAKYNIPWQLLAAISYRESGLSPAGPSGERIGAVNPDSHKVECTTHTECEEKIGSHLKSMADMVYNVKVSASSSVDDIKKSFLAYNRGFMYKRGGCSVDSSPYVMNQFDASHKNMRWPSSSCEPSSTRGRRNIPAGAFTIYAYLVNNGI